MTELEIWYHGTTKKHMKEILKHGFRPDTFFAKHISTAINFGGDYVFAVMFPEKMCEYWEYVCSEAIDESQIVNIIKYKRKLLFRNRKAEKKLTVNIMIYDGVSGEICDYCNGQGQLEDVSPLQRWRDIKTCTTCHICKGYGYIKPKKAR